MAPPSVFEHILRQLQDGRHNPAHPETGGPLRSHYPALHERQVHRQNLSWAQARAARVEAHARRVAAHLKHHARRRRAATHGRRRQVWCVELGRAFASLSAAGRFVGRATENVYQAVRFGTRCGPYHWERFDPTRHAPPGAGVPVLPETPPPWPAECPQAVMPAPPPPPPPEGRAPADGPQVVLPDRAA